MTTNENDIYEFATDDYGITYTSVIKAALTYPFYMSSGVDTSYLVGVIFGTHRLAFARREYAYNRGSVTCDWFTPEVGLAQLQPVANPSLQWLGDEADVFDTDRGITLWLCKEKYNPLTEYPWHFFFGDPFALRMHITGAPTAAKVADLPNGYASYYGVPVFVGCFDYYVWWYGTAGQSYCLPFSVVETEYRGEATTTSETAIPVYIGQYNNFGQTIQYSRIRPTKSLRLRCSVPLSDDDYQTAASIASSPYYYWCDSSLSTDMKRCYLEDFSSSWETGTGDKTIEITIKQYD